MELLAVDGQIIHVINDLRGTHDACTGTAVAGTLGMSKSYIFSRLHLLKEAGIVTFTIMPGSVRVIAPTAVDAAELSTQDGGGPSVGDVPVAKPTRAITPQARGAITRRLNREAMQLAAGERVTHDEGAALHQ